jgi:hypothetical protein
MSTPSRSRKKSKRRPASVDWRPSGFAKAELDHWRSVHGWDIRKATRRRVRCEECRINWADLPSRLCPGCEAYREHQA